MKYYVIITPDTGNQVALTVSANDNAEAMMIAIMRMKDLGMTIIKLEIPKTIK